MIITTTNIFARFNFDIEHKHLQMDCTLISILTPIADDLKQQMQDYPETSVFSGHCTINHVTFFMAHRLGEDMFVDGIQRYLHKLVIQFQRQTDERMQKKHFK